MKIEFNITKTYQNSIIESQLNLILYYFSVPYLKLNKKMNLKNKKNGASENKEKMQYVMDELAKGNRIPFGELMADDFCWKMMGTTPWSGVYNGKKEVGTKLMT